MKQLLSYLFVLGTLILMNSCQKELSSEINSSPSQGSLRDDGTGNCLPKTVKGAYIAGKALVPDSNTIQVTVNVTKTGSYTIYSDTINGYYFKGTGVFSALGVSQVTLKGNGNPVASGIDNFLVTYNSTSCSVPVSVLPAGTGPSVFTLAGSPGSCTGAIVNGTYATGVALGVNNNVAITINVTSIGTYNITTTYQGMTFSGSGAFTTTGIQMVTLNGSGTPTTAGVNNVPITAGSTSCSFQVTVSSPAVGTISCGSAVIGGLYVASTAMVASDTVVLQVNVTTAGAYNISTNTVNGYSFSGSGAFSATGNQTVTLTGLGTPITSGSNTFTVSFGSSNCTFNVTVKDIDYFPRTTNSNWSYESNNNSADSLLMYVIPNTFNVLGNTFNIFMGNDGSTVDTFGYYRRNATNYYVYEDISYFGFDNPVWVEYNFLKDTVANSTWTTDPFSAIIQSTPITVRLRFTINSPRDISKTITSSTGTIIYPNTIVIKEEIEQLNGSTWVSLTPAAGYLQNYYARNVGWILEEVYNGSGSLSGSLTLRRSVVY
ncbi:MAG: hypothetical protein JST17_00830 [Bacteroidetes bacterium]|nr:hypothetical protein [Bacteroidota bacterium]MBS1931828.1 hypothetical protein [Bacteroidota bacterium]